MQVLHTIRYVCGMVGERVRERRKRVGSREKNCGMSVSQMQHISLNLPAKRSISRGANYGLSSLLRGRMAEGFGGIMWGRGIRSG